MKLPLIFIRYAAFLSVVLVQSTSHAGLFDDEEARKAILDLRQKVELLGQTQDKKFTQETQSLREDNQLLKKGLLDLQTMIEQLRGDIAKQTGQQEQLAKDVAELQRRQRDLAQGVDDRMRRLEPVKVNPDGKEFLADPAETKDFEAALALFRKGDFKAATQANLDFLRRYPQSGYQSLALFWLGNSQYANREYREAIANFRSMADANPASPKAPEALLAMANSQIELKDTRTAKKTLEDLVRIYPQSEAALAAKDRLSRLK
jgi:tol-pal system protein YbgF